MRNYELFKCKCSLNKFHGFDPPHIQSIQYSLLLDFLGFLKEIMKRRGELIWTVSGYRTKISIQTYSFPPLWLQNEKVCNSIRRSTFNTFYFWAGQTGFSILMQITTNCKTFTFSTHQGKRFLRVQLIFSIRTIFFF